MDAYESKGRGFESRGARQKESPEMLEKSAFPGFFLFSGRHQKVAGNFEKSFSIAVPIAVVRKSELRSDRSHVGQVGGLVKFFCGGIGFVSDQGGLVLSGSGCVAQ